MVPFSNDFSWISGTLAWALRGSSWRHYQCFFIYLQVCLRHSPLSLLLLLLLLPLLPLLPLRLPPPSPLPLPPPGTARRVAESSGPVIDLRALDM